MQWLLSGQRSRLATSEEIRKIKVRLGDPAGTPHSTPMHRRYPSLGAKSVGFAADSAGLEDSGDETIQISSPRDPMSPSRAKSVGFANEIDVGSEDRGEMTLPSPQVADSPVGDVTN